MKTLKRIGVVLLAAIVLLLVISFFLPSHVHVERSRVVKAKPEAVFAQINDLHNWNNWMPWNRMDPNMKITYADVTSGPGASYSWQSENENVGNGKLTITKSDPNRLVETEMDFMEHGKGSGAFSIEEAADGTKVTWSMDSDMGNNPLFKFMGLFMDNMVGGDFEKGLEDLDNVAAANPIAAPQEPVVAAPADTTKTALNELPAQP
jgi:uncharacterized protein YndB with AHSA1/START domain